MLYIYHCPDFFNIISLVMYEALQANDIPCILSREVNHFPDETWLLFNAMYDCIKKPKKYIVYQTEPVTSKGSYYDFVCGAIQVWDYSLRGYNFFSLVHNNVIYLPFRYAKCLETWNDDDKYIYNEPSDDVLFIGFNTDYRTSVINNIRSQGIKVNYVSGLGVSPLREKLIRNAKINLILQKTPDHYGYSQDIARLFPTGSKRAFMISVQLGECPLSSLVQCSIDELSEKIKYYLNNEDARKKNIEDVYQEIKSLTMANEIKKNMENIKQYL